MLESTCCLPMEYFVIPSLDREPRFLLHLIMGRRKRLELIRRKSIWELLEGWFGVVELQRSVSLLKITHIKKDLTRAVPSLRLEGVLEGMAGKFGVCYFCIRGGEMKIKKIDVILISASAVVVGVILMLLSGSFNFALLVGLPCGAGSGCVVCIFRRLIRKPE